MLRKGEFPMFTIEITCVSYTTIKHNERIEAASYTTTIPLQIPLKTATAIIDEIILFMRCGSLESITHDRVQGRYCFTVGVMIDFDMTTIPDTFYYELDEIGLMKRLATKINVQEVQEIIKAKNKTQKSQ